ncbi:MAG TPA: peptidylprolyl isomerase [Bacillota bacterium]|nr:peptidylprolyl isomerase [Bacillota bacterium]
MLRLKKWSILLLSASLVLGVAGCSKSADKAKEAAPAASGAQDENPVPVVKVDLGMNPKDIVAEYQGGTLTAEQFKDYLEVQAFINPQAGLAINQKDPQALRMFVDSYVAETVMDQRATNVKDADKQGQDLTNQILDKYKQLYKGDQAKLDKQMKDQGVTKEDLNAFFTRYKKVESYLRSQVTDDEIKKQFDQGKKEGAFTLASVRHILIGNDKRKDEDAKKLATDIADRLRKGEDFAKLAKENSEDPGSKDNGGLYENANVNDWVPEFKKAALELPLNQISDPVKTNYGYHVMKVESRKEQTFDEVKDKLGFQLVNDKYDSFIQKDVKDLIKKVNLPEAPKQPEETKK